MPNAVAGYISYPLSNLAGILQEAYGAPPYTGRIINRPCVGGVDLGKMT